MISELFDPAAWRPVPGLDFTDITYHRAVDQGTVRVAFNRPEVRNAFRPHTVDELCTALDHARQSADVGCVLLTGNGPSPKDGGWAFCSGGDQRIRRGARRTLLVAVAVRPPDPLVTARAEGPAPVLGRRPVAGEQHTSNVGRLTGMVEGGAQLVDGVRPEGVAHLGAVERHPDGPLIHRPVIRDVGEVEARNGPPGSRVEKLGDHAGSAYGSGRHRRI